MKFNEQYTVEKHIIKFLSQHLGYEYIDSDEFAKLRSFENEYLIISHLREAIKKINKLTDETEIQNVIREIKKIDSNEGFLNLLINGVNIKDSATGKMRDYLVVDYDNQENNHFVVTNQFYFEGNLENIRPDILVFLNGISVVDIEAKSPTASTTVSYENAVSQIKRYERVAIKLFWPNCFNIATDGLKTVYGATYVPDQYFFQWKNDDFQKKLGGQLEMTLSSLLTKNNLLDIIKNFIVFEQTKDGRIKKIARYQQFRAANKIVARVRDGQKKKGLIWHTQGSGKSLTMFFTAWKLRFNKELNNPKVFVLVDRIDLDNQIYDSFMNCGGKNIIRIASRRDLETKITNDERGIFISTIEKFNELPTHLENPNENIIVLSDEAHRSNEGVAGIKLRDSMRKAFFFGFTGTPIDKTTLNTHRNFGQEGERYLDYYSIQQAIDDGATLPVTYEARLSKFFIDEKKLDQQFDKMTSDLTPEQKQLLIRRYGKKEALVKLDKRMRAVAQDIIDHYRLYIEPNGFKAQIVCYDREATAKYKKLFDELIPIEWTEVVYSPGEPNNDPENLKRYNTTKSEREKIIDKFKDSKSSLKILLVCDMLLTGFDAQIEQAMYLDKPLRDHNLLQAIARTNRVYPNKGCGKIIDYYGITRNLYEALNFDESIIDSALIDFDHLKKEFAEVLKEIKDIFININQEDPSIENLRRCLKIFIDNETKQRYFKDKYSRLKLLFEILSPDPFLVDYIRAFEWLTSVYIAFVNEFNPEDLAMQAFRSGDIPTFREYGEKVKKLIQEQIDYEGITKNFRELEINDIYTLERLDKMEDEEKALNLEKMLKQEISINIDTNPVFQRFSQRLIAIRREFEQHQIDLSERIKLYYQLMSDIKSKSDEAKELGLNLQEYGLFVISQEFLPNADQAILISLSKDLSKQLRSILDDGWKNSSKREEFLKGVKQIIQELILKDYKGKIKVGDFPKFLNRLVDIVIKKF
ncbi:HsdR family type I site-specific deoxyribonuclease [Patescibacteria group bacterium]|nr:HsdR family type I site-specific deoxyribonuclease [Patescibacteria group bacterium]